MSIEPPLLGLLQYLKARQYRFAAVTPATHARNLARPAPPQPDLRDIFGWSRPFRLDQLDPELESVMDRAGIVAGDDAMRKSAVRVASLGDDLFLHSAYPTDAPDAVFFGPDTYRFARFVAERFPARPPRHIADMGAGSGAGGIAAARVLPGTAISLVDTNHAALSLAGINARAAGITVELIESESVPAGPDLIIANPPYMMDRASRAYRDGGDALLGGDLSLRWVRDALRTLPSRGTMLLYTGAAFANGRSPLLDAVVQTCAGADAALRVEELDPDVFGEELGEPAYAKVERIAAVGLTIEKR